MCSEFDTVLAVFTGTTVANLTPVTSNAAGLGRVCGYDASCRTLIRLDPLATQGVVSLRLRQSHTLR